MPGIQGSINGINSNLDTNAIIEAMLTYDKQNVTLLQYDQTVKTNQIATYQALNTRLLALQTSAGLIGRNDAFTSSKINVSDEVYLTATGGDDVGLGTFAVNIDALAQNHQLASQGFSAQEITNLGTGTITIAVGDASPKTITIDSSNNTLEGLKNAINRANVGVKASVVNDGTSSNQYRLILSADKTGAKNTIAFTSNLTGSKALNFATSSFDQVEKTAFSTAATSSPALGTTASYTGNQNKTYTFTVGGTGTQTVGSGDITINWSDGTNSGAIIVSSADTEVVMSGAGSDGLTLQFSAGALVAGDKFQAQTFAPLLQKAQDAKISMGSTTGGGSPLVVTSETNFVKDLIPGVTLNLKKVTTTNPITISVERDSAKIESQVDDFVRAFNDVISAIDAQFKYDPKNTDKTGILFGDRTLLTIQNSLRSQVSSPVAGLSSGYRMLADVGIRTGSTGKLSVVDRSKLQSAIQDHLEDLQKLFAASGDSTNGKISFIALNDKTRTSAAGYDVDVTQAARKGYLRGTMIDDPSINPLVINSTNKNLAIKVDGMVSDTIVLTEKTYSSFSALVGEIQQKINADSKVGKMGLQVDYFDNGENGYINITSGSYGASSKVEIQGGVLSNGYSILGLAAGQVFAGQDVAGTINGERATGSGQILTGNVGNSTTSGLKLRVELGDNELVTGKDATIKILRGTGSRLNDFANTLTKDIDGTIARRTKALETQVDDIKGRVDDLNLRMELKRQRLLTKFMEMEDAIGKLNKESAYLSSQLSSIASTFSQSSSRSTT